MTLASRVCLPLSRILGAGPLRDRCVYGLYVALRLPSILGHLIRA